MPSANDADQPAYPYNVIRSFVVRCPDSFLFVLEFYSPVNNEVMSSRSVNSGTVPGQA